MLNCKNVSETELKIIADSQTIDNIHTGQLKPKPFLALVTLLVHSLEMG